MCRRNVKIFFSFWLLLLFFKTGSFSEPVIDDYGLRVDYENMMPELLASVKGAYRLDINKFNEKKGIFVYVESIYSERSIKKLVSGIEVDMSKTPYSCYCSGDYFLVFYVESTCLIGVKVRHGKTIQSCAGSDWGSDIYLTPKSQGSLKLWLENSGKEKSSEKGSRK